jgi:uncharacterized protein YifE (UPF0438 family)
MVRQDSFRFFDGSSKTRSYSTHSKFNIAACKLLRRNSRRLLELEQLEDRCLLQALRRPMDTNSDT